MVVSWFDGFLHACEKAYAACRPPYPAAAVLFYVARWCQKTAGALDPPPHGFAREEVRGAAERIARNLAEDGRRVDRLVGGDADEWTELRRLLLASAAPRSGGQAGEHADEALQKIAVVLLTGTPPSRAAEQLRRGPEGPRNEYIFVSPFPYWARAVVVNLIVDEQRREQRERRRTSPRGPAPPAAADRAVLEEARDALPGLLNAIRGLGPVQRSVLVLSLCRTDLDEMVRERLHELAPDLFSTGVDLLASDRDIAERLDTTPRLVAANRSAARRKLARRDHRWALLLDVLLPHRSTRPVKASNRAAAGPPAPKRTADDV